MRPEDVGLRTSGRRRVPGLRREELAMLAGISPDYYLRLEQGRGHTPSAQVLDALANALKLDDPATAHLHAISRSSAPAGPGSPERAPHSVELLLGSWPTTPAFVHGRRLDVLAANALASALVPGVLTPGVNLVRATFLDPSVRTLFDDWERVVPPMLEIVRYCGGRITRSCGHHLHLSFPEFSYQPRVVRSLRRMARSPGPPARCTSSERRRRPETSAPRR